MQFHDIQSSLDILFEWSSTVDIGAMVPSSCSRTNCKLVWLSKLQNNEHQPFSRMELPLNFASWSTCAVAYGCANNTRFCHQPVEYSSRIYAPVIIEKISMLQLYYIIYNIHLCTVHIYIRIVCV